MVAAVRPGSVRKGCGIAAHVHATTRVHAAVMPTAATAAAIPAYGVLVPATTGASSCLRRSGCVRVTRTVVATTTCHSPRVWRRLRGPLGPAASAARLAWPVATAGAPAGVAPSPRPRGGARGAYATSSGRGRYAERAPGCLSAAGSHHPRTPHEGQHALPARRPCTPLAAPLGLRLVRVQASVCGDLAAVCCSLVGALTGTISSSVFTSATSVGDGTAPVGVYG